MNAERLLELRKVIQHRFLTDREVAELLDTVSALQTEILCARDAVYRALDCADDPEARELSLTALIKRLELDLNVEYDQRIEAEGLLKARSAYR